MPEMNYPAALQNQRDLRQAAGKKEFSIQSEKKTNKVMAKLT
jgi:hypothetical protein